MKAIIVTLFFVAAVSAQFPSFIKLCKRDSTLNDCLKNNMNGAKGQFITGIPSLFVAKSEPIVIDPDVVIPTPTLKVTIRKGYTYSSLDSFNVKNVNLDLDKNIFNIDWIWETIVAIGSCKFEGKLANFDINGGGNSSSKLNNLGASLTMTGEREQKGDKNYIIFKKTDINMELSQLKGSVYFGGLFPSTEKTESVNKMFNDNLISTVAAFKPVMEKVLVAELANSIQKLFETYSIEELFPL